MDVPLALPPDDPSSSSLCRCAILFFNIPSTEGSFLARRMSVGDGITFVIRRLSNGSRVGGVAGGAGSARLAPGMMKSNLFEGHSFPFFLAYQNIIPSLFHHTIFSFS